jgi:two-component system cell cycle sensor histidine kinase PleC
MPISFSATGDLRRAKALKLGIAAVIAAVIQAMWAVVVVSIDYSRDATLKTMHADAANLAFAFDDEVTHTLNDVAKTMDLFADRMRARDSDMDIYKWSREILLPSDATANGGIVAPDGTVLSVTLSPDSPSINVSDREYFRIQLDRKFNGPFIGKPQNSRVTNQVVIPISMRVMAQDGRFLGVLVFFLSPPQLTKLYHSMDLGERGTLTVIGLDDVVRARFSKTDQKGFDGIGHVTKHDLAADLAAGNDHGTYEHVSSLDHVTRLYSFRRVAGYPLMVSIGLDYNERLKLWWNQAKTIVSLSAIATLLLGGLVFYLIKQIDRRVARDMELAEERRKLGIANGELTASMERAEVANHTKTLFLANMSHELRTPLNAIIGFSQIIKDQIMGPIGKTVYADYARDIQGAGEHLLEIINNLLDISKIEAGKTEISEDLLDTADIVRASVAALRVQAAGKKIALVTDIPPETPFIRGDALRLRQVLINLLSNAVKFTPEGGCVTVSVASDTGRGVVFTVADTGIGMSRDEIEVALEPFSQIENALVKKYEGTGLGLPLAQRLVELHGGGLIIDSAKGVGTTIRVQLPHERTVRAAAAA